jgi:hypothetical protein
LMADLSMVEPTAAVMARSWKSNKIRGSML